MLRAQVLLLMALTALLATTTLAAPWTARGGGHRHGAHEEEAGEAVDCFASGVEDWDSKLHIGAIFIILAVAGVGVYLPVLGHFVPALRLPRFLLTVGKHLGTGVIIATGFIHMLPEASESLSNPCIGGRMGNYGGWAGVLAMMAIFGMHLLEFLMSNHAMGKHGHSHGLPPIEHTHSPQAADGSNKTASLHSHGAHHSPSSDSQLGKPLYIAGAQMPSATSQMQNQENCDAVAIHTHHTHVHGASFIASGNADDVAAERHKASTYILELGICSHSVLIGLTLSVATGTSFTTLLIAIVFHQFCEGLALGSRLAEVRYRRRAFLRAALSAAMFALVTPLGMVIGIGVHKSYAPSSPAALITMGVLDSLSAGILIYTGLVNLLAEEYGTLEFRGYSAIKKVICFAATFIGAGIMALIGKWA